MINRKFRDVLKYLNSLIVKILPKKFYSLFYYLICYCINFVTVFVWRKKYGFKSIKSIPIGELKKSDTLFILGSGSSINDLTEDQWSIIKKHDTLGFNFWLIHEFVPTYYVYEESLDAFRNKVFYENLQDKAETYKNVPLIVKDVEYKGITESKIPISLKKNVYLSTELTVNNVEEKDLKSYLSYGYSFTEMINRKSPKIVLKKTASLSYLLHLAQLFNYKNIVLCGVDLVDSRFFYNDTRYNGSKTPERDLYELNPHPTDVTTKNKIRISKVIDEFYEVILRKNDIKLYTGSQKSALYSKYGYFFDGENNHKQEC